MSKVKCDPNNNCVTICATMQSIRRCVLSTILSLTGDSDRDCSSHNQIVIRICDRGNIARQSFPKIW